MHVKIKLPKKMNVHSGRAKNGKFVKLTHFKKNRPKSMKPPRPTQRKYAFKLSYSFTTTKKKNFAFFDQFIYYLLLSIK